MKVLIAESEAAPAGLIRPVAAALRALDVELVNVDLGSVGDTGSRLGRVVQAIMGEAEAGRLVRALATSPAPDVALAFDAGALAALAVARSRRAVPTVVVGVVPDLAPSADWAVEADRFVTVDDEAAVALSDHGVDGARVAVCGPIVGHALHAAARGTRAAARAALKLPADMPMVLVDARGLSLETLEQVTMQLSLVERAVYVLFDAGPSADAAALARRQVPALGLKGKLFGETASAPQLWRCADAVIGRAAPRNLHAALALGTPLLALEPDGERELADAQGLAERRLGGACGKVMLLAAALEPLLVRGAQRGLGGDGAAAIAELIVQLGAHRDEVLAETVATKEPEVSEAAAAEPEDFDSGPVRSAPAPDLSALRDQVADAEKRVKRELDEARAEAEKWDQRKLVAEAQGDTRVAEQATREADRKRARMHLALEELGRIAAQRGRVEARAGAAPRSDDPLASFKKKVAASPGPAPSKPKNLDDQLAELKRKMESDKKRK